MSKFKIGDRVKVIKSSFMAEQAIGAKGTVVAIDGRGLILVKLDKDIGSYSHCCYHNYTSDKEDLFNTVDEELVHLKQTSMIKLKWIYLLGSALQTGSCITSFISGDFVLANTHLILAVLFLNWYRNDVRKEGKAHTSAYIDGNDLIITIEKHKNEQSKSN